MKRNVVNVLLYQVTSFSILCLNDDNHFEHFTNNCIYVYMICKKDYFSNCHVYAEEKFECFDHIVKDNSNQRIV